VHCDLRGMLGESIVHFRPTTPAAAPLTSAGELPAEEIFAF